MNNIHKITFFLLIIGGLNWGLELFGWGVGNFIPMSLAQLVYALVALSALYEIFFHKSICKTCDAGSMQKPMGTM
jgi:uncharacterized membrane protein YuzA (DUF378 family)